MSTRQEYGQQSHETALQTTTTGRVYPAPSAGSSGQDEDGHILVHFNGHFNGQFNGAFVLPNNMQQQAPAESDAQIAARRAMAKRNSRSFAARITRNRSRKMEFARTAKPGITVDTSFARHRGNVPHQVYPQDNERRSGGSIRKQGWFGLGRSDTKNKGLGIVKGMTPQPGRSSEDRERSNKEPKTADSLTAGSKSWQEISPWDRPIPIGITVPSDSVTDFSPYQAARARSDSDATLATPNIIVTPAAAMKSVWSPDTASDYTASSAYSRATHMPPWASDVPPVPTLPADVHNMHVQKAGIEVQRDWNFNYPNRARGDTLESSDTAFEEEQDDIRKDRIMSTGTVFEEDDTPLHEKKLKTLSVDTSMVPTPRRSQGWWNVITTPFVMSRTNSVWTQGGRNGEKTPDIPMVPAGFGTYRNSPSPSTYIWSATDRSPSALGESPMYPAQAKFLAPTTAEVSGRGQNNINVDLVNNIDIKAPPAPRTIDAVNNPLVSAPKAMSVTSETAFPLAQPTPKAPTESVSPPLTDKSASPPVGTIANAGLAVGLSPHPQQPQPQPQLQPINVNIAFHDGRVLANSHSHPSGTSAQTQPGHVIVAPLPAYANSTTSRSNTPPQAAPFFFPPPPNASSKDKQFSFGNFSRASSPGNSVHEAKQRQAKQHRKMNKFLSKLALCGRKKDDKKNEKKKKRSRRCMVCCCCLILLILLAVLIPIIVIFTRKHNNSTTPIAGTPVTTSDGPSQWLNNTGYPPMKTGLLTIAQPEAVEEQSGCVAPTTLWSCALPKEQQKDIQPNKPDQPNFKVEITFQNGTAADLSKPTRRAANPVSAGAFMRSLLRRATPSPSPAPPSTDDMKFLGQTTDGVSAPFEGETTPFFMTFQDPSASTSSSAPRSAKRADDPTNITLVIPPPSLNSDGTAAAANLLPLPSAQPLRLFNRGKSDEHYGFYTYFDRSIFLKDISSSTGRGGNPADTNGGSTRDAATLRCTFTQTRFLVQIWTRSNQPLLNPPQNTTDNAFKRPGTFPYPVTFTLDRHGGDVTKKNLFCYKMEKDGTIVNKDANKFFQFEDRGFGGNLVNGTQGRPNAKGPIDGGSGGCGCKWQNWVD
ncbi:hypothetical protein PSPO01_11811 [Paraphaeosphaeria sporulosa]